MGNRLKTNYFDDNHIPVRDHAEIHEIRQAFNERNMLSNLRYFDTNGATRLNGDVIHEIRYWRDTLGRQRQTGNYNIQGGGVKDFANQVYMSKYTYNALNRYTVESFFADSVSRLPLWDGCFEQIAAYNEDGQTQKNTSLNAYGDATPTQDGASELQLIYKPNGSLLERRFLHDHRLIKIVRGVTSNYISASRVQSKIGTFIF